MSGRPTFADILPALENLLGYEKPATGDRVFVAGLGFGFVRGEHSGGLYAVEVPAIRGMVHIPPREFFPAPIEFGPACHISLEVGRA